MTTLAVSTLIGTMATLHFQQLKVYVRIMDVKQAYGRTRYLVTPKEGKGSQWVESLTFGEAV